MGAFIGGPLAATVLIARNFGALRRKRSRNQTYLLGLGLTLSYFWLVFEIPTHIADRIPTAVYGAVVSLIAYVLTENLQGKLLKTHFANLGQKASGWAVAGWSLLSMIVTFGIAFLYLPMIPPFDFEGNVYKEGLLGNEIYHSDDIDVSVLATLGDYLIEAEYFDSEYSVPIQLVTEKEGYRLTLPCLRSLWDDEETLEVFRVFTKAIEDDALLKPVSLSLVDEDFSDVYRKDL